ncbi:MAG TPA: Wzz/FepE/Etk N-terminal domain-containing protein, partial [Armatimonadota bacterium]|nr:Wzz/FepE/Etk N-terminal domain-containing protein [Armatimonadota bacterium]
MDTEKGILPGSGTTQPAGYLPGPGGPQFYYEEPPQVDLRDYLRIFLKRRRIILLVFAGVVASALAYTITAPRIYQATAKVQVLQPQQSGMLVVPIADQQKPEDSLKTQAKIVQSSIVAEQTAQRLQTDHHVNISPQEIMGSVKVAIEDPDVLAISAVNRDPARAAKIANAVQDTYIGHNTSLARAEASNARAFLEQQLPRVESELKRAEDAVSEY